MKHSRSKLRLATLVSHPIQYQAPLFRALARHPDVDFTAVFFSEHGLAPTLDPGFGRGGKVVTGFSSDPRDTASSLVRRPDGRLVVAGGHSGSGSTAQSDLAFAQYRADGKLDARFGNAGRLLTDLGESEEVAGVALQADGKLLALGLESGGRFRLALARYRAPAVCVVPRVLHRSLRRARRALSQAGCPIGRIAKRRSKRPAGVVIGQKPRAGARLMRGAVSLVVSRGR